MTALVQALTALRAMEIFLGQYPGEAAEAERVGVKKLRFRQRGNSNEMIEAMVVVDREPF